MQLFPKVEVSLIVQGHIGEFGLVLAVLPQFFHPLSRG
jgi:hypothetical protein